MGLTSFLVLLPGVCSSIAQRIFLVVGRIICYLPHFVDFQVQIRSYPKGPVPRADKPCGSKRNIICCSLLEEIRKTWEAECYGISQCYLNEWRSFSGQLWFVKI